MAHMQMGGDLIYLLDNYPPPPPVPFIGRIDLLQTLSRVGDLPHIVIILGLPGVGKSALLRQITRSFNRTGIFWYECRQGLSSIGDILARLAQFLDRQLNAGGNFARSIQALHQQAKVEHMISVLNKVQCCLCFDAAHHVIDDPAIISFFEQLKEHLTSGTVFVTSRSTPPFYRASDPDRGRVREVVLDAFSDDEVHDFCLQNEIVVTEAVQKAIEQFGGLPLALELLTSLLQGNRQEVKILQLTSRVKQRTMDELFEIVYQSLEKDTRELLLTAALFNLPFSQDQLILAHTKIANVSGVRVGFKVLQRQMLIHQEAADSFKVHEIIRILAADYTDDIAARRKLLAEALIDKPEREMMAHLEAILLLFKTREYDQAAELAVPLIDECLIPEYVEIADILLTRFIQDQVSPEHWLWLHGCQGHLALFRGRFEEAAEHFHTMLHLAEQIDDKNGMAIAYLRLGNVYLDLDHAIAAKYYDASLSLRIALEDTEGHGLLLNNIGLLYIKQQRFEEADVAFKQGLALLDAAGTPDWRKLSIIGNLGYLHNELEQWAEARQYAEQVYTIAETNGLYHDCALSLYNMGVQEERQGHRDVAHTFYNRAFDLADRHKFVDVEALVQVAEGRSHERNRAYDEAIQCFERVAAIHEQTGNYGLLAAIRFDIGTFQWYKGDLEAALDNYVSGIALFDHLTYEEKQVTQFLTNVRNLAEEVTNPRLLVIALIALKNRLRIHQPMRTYPLARVYGTIGHIFIDVLDRNRVGLACLRCEVQLLAKSARSRELIEALSDLGVTYEKYHHYGRAIDTMSEALDLLSVHTDPYLSALNQYNRGNSFAHLDLWEQAEASYQQALLGAESIGNTQLSNAVCHNLGEIYRRQGRLTEAQELLQGCLAVGPNGEDPSNTVGLLNNIGLLYEEQGQFLEACTYFERAIALSREHGLAHDEANTLISYGNLYIKQNEHAAAISYYEQARIVASSAGDTDLEEGSILSLGYAHWRLGTFILPPL